MAKKGRRVGRPPKPQADKMSPVISIRLAPDLKIALDRAAKSSGRSLGQEVGARLRLSLADKAKYGDDQTRALAVAITHIADQLGGYTNRPWHKSHWAFKALKAGLQTIMEPLEPADENPPDAEGFGHGEPPEKVGTLMALFVLKSMTHTGPHLAGMPFVVEYIEQGDMEAGISLAQAGRILGLTKNGDDK